MLTAREPDSTMSPGCAQHPGTISRNLYTENTSLLHTHTQTDNQHVVKLDVNDEPV